MGGWANGQVDGQRSGRGRRSGQAAERTWADNGRQAEERTVVGTLGGLAASTRVGKLSGRVVLTTVGRLGGRAEEWIGADDVGRITQRVKLPN